MDWNAFFLIILFVGLGVIVMTLLIVASEGSSGVARVAAFVVAVLIVAACVGVGAHLAQHNDACREQTIDC